MSCLPTTHWRLVDLGIGCVSRGEGFRILGVPYVGDPYFRKLPGADYGLWSLNPMTSQSLLYEDFLLYWCPGHLTDCHVQSSGREPPKEDGQAEDAGHD